MKRLIFIITMLMLMAVSLYADTTKVIYITRTDTTLGTRNANVDSIRNDIVNDPMGQLPGIWKVDLCAMADVEGKAAAFWTYYNLIITFGSEEGSGDEGGGAADYDTFLDGVFDTLKKPIITRNAWLANGNPMRLGTAARATEIDRFKLDNTTHFITRNTYTDNAHWGDTVMLYSASVRAGHGLRGMANAVQTLVRWPGEIRSDDADTALIAILDSNATNASGTTAPNRRAYFALATSWQYCSWAARDLWYRTLRWAIADTVIDTCVTRVNITREGIDGNFLEYSGSNCQTTWHYGGFTNGFLTGSDIRDRSTLIRARTSAITTQLPDTSTSWAYDIVDTKLIFRIKGVAENVASRSFSFWQGLFEILYADQCLWLDAKASYQLDSTCASWLASEPDTLCNSHYLKYPSIPWASAQASTRGTDYSTIAFDSMWIQDPILESHMIFGNLKNYIEEARADSLDNQGVMTHTIGTVTNDAEISLYTEITGENFGAVRYGPRWDITLAWRPANEAAPDLDSSIAWNPDSVVFSGYVDGEDPDNQYLQFYNGSSSEIFTCTLAESPSADWLALSTLIGGGETPGYQLLNPDLTGLAAGYYSTYVKATCTGVSDSPDSAKVVLRVNPQPGVRQVGGKLKF